MSTSPFDNFISRLSKVRRTSNGVSAACPAHADKNNSLSVSQASDGRVLIKCLPGCSGRASRQGYNICKFTNTLTRLDIEEKSEDDNKHSHSIASH